MCICARYVGEYDAFLAMITIRVRSVCCYSEVAIPLPNMHENYSDIIQKHIFVFVKVVYQAI